MLRSLKRLQQIQQKIFNQTRKKIKKERNPRDRKDLRLHPLLPLNLREKKKKAENDNLYKNQIFD